MNRRSVLMLAIVGLLVCCQGVFAQEKKKRPPGGTVKAVDADKGTITVAVGRKGETQDKTFKLAKAVKVTIEGETKTLADVKVGARVRLTLEGDEVVAISVGGRKKKE